MVAPPLGRADDQTLALPAAKVSRSEAPVRPGPLVTAVVAILVAATCIPLGYVAWGFVSVGWTRAYELIVRPRVGELLFNTVALVIVTVPLCVVIGVGVAWLVERTDLPGRAFWRPLFVAPLAIPAFVNSYAWVGVIPSLHGLWAGVLITTLSYFPFMYLPAAATLRRLDPAVEEIGPHIGIRFGRCVLPCRAAAAAAGDARRRIVDRRTSARRIRRLRNGAIRHLHRRDLPAVPGHLRRRGRQHAGRCPCAALPGSADRRGGGTRQREVRPDRLGSPTRRDTGPLGPQCNTGLRRADRVGHIGARGAGVDDSALAVDRGRQTRGRSTTSAPHSSKPSVWPRWRRS